jgi:hypothetical protein
VAAFDENGWPPWMKIVTTFDDHAQTTKGRLQ